jgi:uncharacterized protein involved in exopolysaccharide biosynthesis
MKYGVKMGKAKRGLNPTIAIVLCILVGAGSFGLGYAVQQRSINALEDEVTSLQQNYNNLVAQFQTLEQMYDALNSRYQSLQGSYSTLNSRLDRILGITVKQFYVWSMPSGSFWEETIWVR